jgi:holin-like protein
LTVGPTRPTYDGSAVDGRRVGRDEDGRSAMIDSCAERTPIALLSAGVARRAWVGFRLAGQFSLLIALYYSGTVLVQVFGVPLPGNLVGMLLLLGLFRLGVVRIEQLDEAATLLVQHLNLFFIPLAVGLMAWGGLLGASGAGLGLCLAGSVAICLAVAGLVGQRMVDRRVVSDAR